MGFRFITFATSSYRSSAHIACISAQRIGATSTFIYNPDEIESSQTIMDALLRKKINWEERGAGFWIWKPAIILNELQHMRFNETLVYADAGILLNDSILNFIDHSQNNKIKLWTLDQKENSVERWTDYEVLQKLKVKIDDFGKPMIIAGVLIVPNTTGNRKVIKDWMDLCNIPSFLSPDRDKNYQPSKQVIWHRHDQSLLTVLTILNPERFKISEYKTKLLMIRSLPFIIHRQQELSVLLVINHFEKTKRFLRLVLALLPTSARIKIKKIRSKRNISAVELDRHRDFFSN